MKKIIISILYITCLIPQPRAQETLSLKQCREMALKYNKEMAASAKQTESARYTAKSYKGNFLPNFTLSGQPTLPGCIAPPTADTVPEAANSPSSLPRDNSNNSPSSRV